MTISVSPTQDDVYTALRSFLIGILPGIAASDIIQGQVNRAAEPSAANFAVFWEISRRRLATNIDAWADCAFTASIVGDLMTVSDVAIGTIEVGNQVFGTGLSGTTTILDQISGSIGGTGVYQVGPAQTVVAQVLAAGGASFLQKLETRIQLDVHGPDGSNNATVISTLFRDAYAVDQFAVLAPDVVPFYADDPRQLPFVNENQQYEDRWVLDVYLQVDAVTIGIPQQFAGVIDVELVDVDAAFPA